MGKKNQNRKKSKWKSYMNDFLRLNMQINRKWNEPPPPNKIYNQIKEWKNRTNL